MWGLPIEVFLGLASLILGWFAESKKQQAHDLHEERMAAKDSADSAQRRGGATIRMIVALIVIVVAFGGLLIPQFLEDSQGVSQIFDKDPWLNLFGIIKFGGGKDVIVAQGFVIPEYMKYSVISIIHFLFGMAAGKR